MIDLSPNICKKQRHEDHTVLKAIIVQSCRLLASHVAFSTQHGTNAPRHEKAAGNRGAPKGRGHTKPHLENDILHGSNGWGEALAPT